MQHEIIDKMTARARGQKFFYTGMPCKYGHISQRYSSTGACVDCLKWSATKSVSPAPNVFYLSRPLIMDGGDLPTQAEWAAIEQHIFENARGFLAMVRNRKGPAMPGIEHRPRLAIDGHECWLCDEVLGRQYYWPVYMQAVMQDDRINPASKAIFRQKDRAGGIWWDKRWMKWMVSYTDSTNIHTFVMTDEQRAWCAANIPVDDEPYDGDDPIAIRRDKS